MFVDGNDGDDYGGDDNDDSNDLMCLLVEEDAEDVATSLQGPLVDHIIPKAEDDPHVDFDHVCSY